MKRADCVALLLAIVAIAASYLVTVNVFERMPHIEDEMAYVWQADVIAGGHLTLPTPLYPKSFMVPFVVDYHGQRFGKYPPGWPAMLALGVLFNARAWVNPLLAGLSVWLIYRLGKKLFGAVVGVLAAILTITSPFFLMNTGSLLSHPFGLALGAVFTLAWLDAWDDNQPSRLRWLVLVLAALSLGLLVLTRPLTAVGICLPFLPHGVYLFVRGKGDTRRRLLVFGVIALGMSALFFAWQFAVTGNPLLNPYTLWWDYDKIGFGPGYGRISGGHTLRQAWINTKFSLMVGYSDLYGWGIYSWIFLPFGLIALLLKRNWKALLPVGILPALVLVYMAYWIGSSLFGPRYYYEGLVSLNLLTALGIAFLAGWPLTPQQPWQPFTNWKRFRAPLMAALLVVLVGLNLYFYLPGRLEMMHGLYGVSRSHMLPFQTAEARKLAPAVVVVFANHWTEYGTLLELENPTLTTPFIFVLSQGDNTNRAIARDFPQRRMIDYYPNEPYKLYLAPR